MRDISDEELMTMYQQGDAGAFELLFERHRTPIFGFLYRMLNREKASAEDLLQEIFTKIAKARHLYEPRAKFSTWLYAIARNHCINHIKSRRYRQSMQTTSLDAADPTTGASMLDFLKDERPVNDTDLQERLEWAISTLPSAYREVFLLHAVRGFSHAEAAKILGMNPATVRTHYHRARLMLCKRAGNLIDTEKTREQR